MIVHELFVKMNGEVASVQVKYLVCRVGAHSSRVLFVDMWGLLHIVRGLIEDIRGWVGVIMDSYFFVLLCEEHDDDGLLGREVEQASICVLQQAVSNNTAVPALSQKPNHYLSLTFVRTAKIGDGLSKGTCFFCVAPIAGAKGRSFIAREPLRPY